MPYAELQKLICTLKLILCHLEFRRMPFFQHLQFCKNDILDLNELLFLKEILWSSYLD